MYGFQAIKPITCITRGPHKNSADVSGGTKRRVRILKKDIAAEPFGTGGPSLRIERDCGSGTACCPDTACCDVPHAMSGATIECLFCPFSNDIGFTYLHLKILATGHGAPAAAAAHYLARSDQVTCKQNGHCYTLLTPPCYPLSQVAVMPSFYAPPFCPDGCAESAYVPYRTAVIYPILRYHPPTIRHCHPYMQFRPTYDS